MTESIGFSQVLSPAAGQALRSRRIWIGLLLGLILLTVVMAPVQGGGDRRGSTYSRAPSGYGAWAEYMAERGTPLQSWEQSLATWSQEAPAAAQTLIQIDPNRSAFDQQQSIDTLSDWISQGHTLVIVGSGGEATRAPFRTRHSTEWGTVLVETSRRQSPNASPSANLKVLLSDDFGVLVRQIELEAGTILEVVPPYLGANAYQALSGNYPFLAQLVDRGGEIWVDEFLHGYQALDPEETAANPDQSGDWMQYLLSTPLALILLQASIGLILLIVARNRRFGVQLPWEQPSLDNTTAYIQALGAVLHKAESYAFVVDTLHKQELARLRRSLGLAAEAMTTPITPEEQQNLIQAWCRATGRTAADLDPLLQPPSGALTEAQVQRWLGSIDLIRQALPD